ncbi:LuxR family transcriptional regulator [Nonomuraea phyllanthi]|uniref:LuxR family transcriptional regulator n=2 Tax=Nonomuraea phyllanthi TaxID=2219224 RepID=A0A5C4WT49_9ACTN|nr:LuxR family transcriptional regulator [Nonomuraea phyllanthi]
MPASPRRRRGGPPAWTGPARSNGWQDLAGGGVSMRAMKEELSAFLDMLQAPLEEVLPRLSTLVAELVPHKGMVTFTGDCLVRPSLHTHGFDAVSTDELARLAELVRVRRSWFGRVALAGTERPVLAVTISPPGMARGFVAIALSAPDEPSPEAVRTVRRLFELVTVQVSNRMTAAEQPAAAGIPSPSVADATEAHATTLTALLGVLRAKRLDDATARRTAIELAVPALIEARAGGERRLDQEPAGEAFAAVAGKLDVLTRYHDIALELEPPRPQDRPLPGTVARAARAIVRAAILTMLQQGALGRIRLAWQVEDAQLVVSVRDDGPGAITSEDLGVHRLLERAVELNGTVTVDSVPHWGTTITVVLPLSQSPALERPAGSLDSLNPREQEVLEQLTLGHRNRVIAHHLGISENTVKFHVANILGKLGVGSRGEAAALALRPQARP